MNKQDWIWLAIRISGIYLLVHAILYVPDLLSSIIGVVIGWDTRHAPAVSGEVTAWRPLFDMGQMEQGMFKLSVTLALKSGFSVLICGGAGWYLIRKGNLVFRMVCPPDEK